MSSKFHVFPICSSPRLLMKYVRNTRSPSRMNVFVPCHSSTAKSLSNPSVIVYQGMNCQPIRAFRRSISLCGARDANASVVSRAFRMSGVSDLVGHHGAADACMFGPADHARLEEGAVDDQLPAAVEQIEQVHLALRPVELVLLLHGHPWHPSTLRSQRVTGAGQLLLLHQQFLACGLPLLRRHDLVFLQQI